jgi:hypothetical protein
MERRMKKPSLMLLAEMDTYDDVKLESSEESI